jgi:hypothetical protein
MMVIIAQHLGKYLKTVIAIIQMIVEADAGLVVFVIGEKNNKIIIIIFKERGVACTPSDGDSIKDCGYVAVGI